MTAFPKPIRQERPKSPLRRTRMKAIGRRGREWDSARRAVRERLEAAGIRSCEFGFAQCTGAYQTSLAHAVKRRFVQREAESGTPEHIETVAIACGSCHQKLDEEMSHQMMCEQVMSAIARRA